MINLFSLVHLQPGERVEHVYRSHPLRLFSRLFVATTCLVIPFFFLFDYEGWIWIVAVLCWLWGAMLLWLAFDVWSSSLVIITSSRLIGAERTSWGRVRVHDWRLVEGYRQPIWKKTRWLPWLGTLTWRQADGPSLSLPWARRMPEATGVAATAEVVKESVKEVAKPVALPPPTLEERREHLIERVKKLDVDMLVRLEGDIDASENA
jgi:hypothetical protein